MNNKNPEKKIEHSNSEIDQYFIELKENILKKHEKKSKIKEKEHGNLLCKICGEIKYSKLLIRECKNCKLSICQNCRSCGFCLNCWVNLNENARKMLKLTKLLLFVIPAITLYVLFFQSLLLYLIANLTMISFLAGYHIYLVNNIQKNPKHYFKENWLKIIETNTYKQLLDPKNKNRYIQKKILLDFKGKKEKKIKKLKDWIEPKTDFSDIPIPAHYQKKEDLEQLKQKIFTENQLKQKKKRKKTCSKKRF